jgi:hypothetical protein
MDILSADYLALIDKFDLMTKEQLRTELDNYPNHAYHKWSHSRQTKTTCQGLRDILLQLESGVGPSQNDEVTSSLLDILTNLSQDVPMDIPEEALFRRISDTGEGYNEAASRPFTQSSSNTSSMAATIFENLIKKIHFSEGDVILALVTPSVGGFTVEELLVATCELYYVSKVHVDDEGERATLEYVCIWAGLKKRDRELAEQKMTVVVPCPPVILCLKRGQLRNHMLAENGFLDGNLTSQGANETRGGRTHDIKMDNASNGTGHKQMVERLTGKTILYFEKSGLLGKLETSLVFRRMSPLAIQHEILRESTYELDIDYFWRVLKMFKRHQLSSNRGVLSDASVDVTIFTGCDMYDVVRLFPIFQPVTTTTAFRHLVLGEWGPVTNSSMEGGDPWKDLSLRHFSNVSLIHREETDPSITKNLIAIAVQNFGEFLVFLYGIDYTGVMDKLYHWVRKGEGAAMKWKPNYILELVNDAIYEAFKTIKTTSDVNYRKWNLSKALSVTSLNCPEGVTQVFATAIANIEPSVDYQALTLEAIALRSVRVVSGSSVIHKKQKTDKDEGVKTPSMKSPSMSYPIEEQLCRNFTMHAFKIPHAGPCPYGDKCHHLHPKDLVHKPLKEFWELVYKSPKGFKSDHITTLKAAIRLMRSMEAAKP